MKKMIFILMLMMATTLSTEAHRYHRMHVTISMQTFYDELSPYGDWIYTSDYGYVWRPYFDNPYAFRPYSSGGNWVYTEYGWTWASDYRWGWAPFHYGRWYFDDYLGWMWIPGYEWAPAWVTWGNYGDYYGWAPLGPNIYVSVNFNWYAPDPWWTFVPRRHFCSSNWRHYIYDRPVQVNNITYITNIYNGGNNNYRNQNNWFYGPRVSDVERYGNTRVRKMQVIDSDRPDRLMVNNGQVSVYRPTVDRSRNDVRPNEYRRAESVRSETRLAPQNPRTNDPGAIRTRDEMRNTTRNAGTSPHDYDAIQTRTNRVESGSVNTNRIEPAPSNRGVNERNGTEVKSQNRTEPASGQRNERTFDNSRSADKRERTVSPETKPIRNNEPARENVNPNATRESQARSSSETKTARSQEPRKETPQRVNTSNNTERHKVKSETEKKNSRDVSSEKSSRETSRSGRNR